MPYEDWLENIRLNLGGRRLLVIIDDFEKIGSVLEEQKITKDLFNELRHLIQHDDQLSFLLSGVPTLNKLGPNWSDYFINVVPIEVAY